jgi:hypothetical protein
MKHQPARDMSGVLREVRALAALALLSTITAPYASAACDGPPRDGTDPESLQRATDILESNGVEVSEEYRVIRLVAYESGAGMVWVKRLYKDVPVFRDELAFHFTSDEKLRRTAERPFLGGEGEPWPVGIDIAPAIDANTVKARFAEQARVVGVDDLTGRPAGTLAGPDFSARLDELDAELGIYEGELAWLVCHREGAVPYGYYSARTGGELYFESGVVAGAPPQLINH